MIWPSKSGLVSVRLVQLLACSFKFQALIRNGESLDFSGKTLVALASDANMFRKTGRVLPTVELAREYGIREDDGSK